MIPASVERVLAWAALAHLAVGVACAAALLIDAPPVLGVHPAWKPMKFGISIALFLAALAVIVPALAVAPAVRRALAWTLVLAMAVEHGAIVGQAVRGVPSHFNQRTPVDAAAWQAMVVAIVVATVAMIAVAALATWRPLRGADGRPLPALLATAWRAGLWLFLVAAQTWVGMGGRVRHSIGCDDGGPGLPLTHWSTEHGDLRVAHFLSLHALQTLPLIALGLARLPIAAPARWAALVLALIAHVAIIGLALAQARAGRPLW